MVAWNELRHGEQLRLQEIARKAFRKSGTGHFRVYDLIEREHEVREYGKFITHVELTNTEIKYYDKNGNVFVKTTKRTLTNP